MYLCKVLFLFDCFMNKDIYSEIINTYFHSDQEVIYTLKNTFTNISLRILCRNPSLKHSLSQPLMSDFRASIINRGKKISDLADHFVTPQAWMCEIL